MVKECVKRSSTSSDHRRVALSGSIYFKRLILKSWNASEEEEKENRGRKGTLIVSISKEERHTIRTHLVDFMCQVPDEKIRSQFSEAIGVISKNDFPDRWKTLLPNLLARVDPDDMRRNIAVLNTLSAVFNRFVNVSKTDENLYPLKVALQQFGQEPMLKIFNVLCAKFGHVAANDNAREQIELVLDALNLIVKIFYALNWLDLPEFFEDHMKDYFTMFDKFLNHQNKVLEARADEYTATRLDELKKNVVGCLNLYAGKYEEEFLPFFPTFATNVWKQLQTSTKAPRHDNLVIASMKFLSSVVQRSMHKKVFDNEAALTSLCGDIVVPNLELREHDEDSFEDNPLEYIRLDIEGSDAATRRRGACDLVRALCVQFQDQITPMGLRSVENMLKAYAADRAKRWKMKDAAMNLLLALSVKTQTMQHGANELNPRVNVMTYFAPHILTELQGNDVDRLPIIKADAIKFVTMFRQKMNRSMLTSLFPLMIRHLGAKSVVVHTYAANWIERVLVLKDPQTKALKIDRATLKPMLKLILVGLFGILERPNYMASSCAPDYIMKTIMRVVGVAKEDVMPFLGVVLDKLKVLVAMAAKNPTNPKYHHFMFETMAALVSNVGKANPSTVVNFQQSLFPSFQLILSQQIESFMPYVLQIMAQLLKLSPNGITKPFQAMFPKILHPSQYELRGNVPALVELLKAYLQCPGNGPNSTQTIVVPRLTAVLGVWQKLCVFKSTELHALRLLEVIVSSLPLALYASLLSQILAILVQRLQKVKGMRFKYIFIPTFLYLIGKIGGSIVVKACEGLNKGLFSMLMTQVVLKHVCDVAGAVDRKACAVGLSRLLGETEQFRDPLYHQLASQCLIGTVRFLNSQDPSDSKSGADEDKSVAEIEYNSMAKFSRLSFATAKRGDGFPTIRSPLEFFKTHVARLNQVVPGIVMKSGAGVSEGMKRLGM